MTELLTRCPSCGYRHEVASAIGGDGPRKPDAGSVSVCIACGELGIFENDFVGLRIRLPTEEEQAELDADPMLQQVREAWREVEKRHPHAWPGRA